MRKFDWPALLKVGVVHLRLKPKEFWRLTPAELVLMLGGPGSVKPMDRTRLDELISAWPDKTEG
ncbi:phage tail assembly chaperone [Defluviimonas sp. WL0002]|uniref:Phage tail assembly chaperone n=1 Tax=Albidovulum marisflavi TaxID=2984159 RepID=A0ABT2ZBR4_9RHOB|nr:rcc01693 family protein [Defluviimonas sp. WL0002]MCV2868536.1 phage tail assembly chaperone [Defluviimonas sp. WL0002]